MVTSLRSREKKRVIEQLLIGDHVLLHLVPQAPGVELPSHLMENLTVTLKISRHFRGALLLHNSYIEAHLLFGDSYCECRVPYDAIWGVTSEYGDTTSWLEGFNDSGTPRSSSDSLEDFDTSLRLDQRENAQVSSGNAISSLDKSNHTATLLQTIESLESRFEQAPQTTDFHDSESGDNSEHNQPRLLTSQAESQHDDQKVGSIVPGEETPEAADPGGTEELSPGELREKDEENATTSFPPRLQSVLRSSSDKLSSSDSHDGADGPTGVLEDKEIPDGTDKAKPSPKLPSSRPRQSGKSDSTNRPKLVRVK